jgi:hypothetical protein
VELAGPYPEQNGIGRPPPSYNASSKRKKIERAVRHASRR